ncbi:uncharacterized protein LOC121253195 [Juglans microcarpa x Juglans regia]|uniref:uncharacterized protein LOC121253195 n=1 Tax=Juglans microcarpa x Juglans regia TaxID=2249226 RepID=UPI001B7ED1A2|nr:uncharacterized protein LOC121253195 [Juglans microcarpa x Juglans regia]
MEGIPSTMKTGEWSERVPSVYYCGYPSQKSYGSASYLIVNPEGNILIDNSRNTERLASNIDEAGVLGATLQAVNLSDEIKLNQNSCRKVFKWAVRLAILVNDAKVVHFLHVGVIHGSFDNGLKTNNILINEHWVARLSDDGMSIILEGSDKFGTKGIQNWGAARKMFDEILKRGNRIKVIKAIPILGLFFGGMVLNQFGLFRNLTDVKVLPKWDISLLFENGLKLSFARLKALAKLVFGPDLVNCRSIDEGVVVGATLSIFPNFCFAVSCIEGKFPAQTSFQCCRRS